MSQQPLEQFPFSSSPFLIIASDDLNYLKQVGDIEAYYYSQFLVVIAVCFCFCSCIFSGWLTWNSIMFSIVMGCYIKYVTKSPFNRKLTVCQDVYHILFIHVLMDVVSYSCIISACTMRKNINHLEFHCLFISSIQKRGY